MKGAKKSKKPIQKKAMKRAVLSPTLQALRNKHLAILCGN